MFHGLANRSRGRRPKVGARYRFSSGRVSRSLGLAKPVHPKSGTHPQTGKTVGASRTAGGRLSESGFPRCENKREGPGRGGRRAWGGDKGVWRQAYRLVCTHASVHPGRIPDSAGRLFETGCTVYPEASLRNCDFGCILPSTVYVHGGIDRYRLHPQKGPRLELFCSKTPRLHSGQTVGT